MALSPKRQRFVDEYIVDLNATQAAIRAGYAKASAGQQGDRLLKNEQIKRAVDEALAARAARTEITADLVLTGIRETIDRCSQAKPVLDRNGDPVMVETPTGEMAPAYAFDSAAVLKGYELLGKHIGLFPNKQVWNGTLTVRNEDAVPRPATFDEWLRYQSEQATPVQALPALEKAAEP